MKIEINGPFILFRGVTVMNLLAGRMLMTDDNFAVVFLLYKSLQFAIRLSIRYSWGNRICHLVVDVLATTFLFDLCQNRLDRVGWYSLPNKGESVDDDDDAVCCCWSFDSCNAFLVSYSLFNELHYTWRARLSWPLVLDHTLLEPVWYPPPQPPTLCQDVITTRTVPCITH